MNTPNSTPQETNYQAPQDGTLDVKTLIHQAYFSTTPQTTIDIAVKVMNDWSGGQVDQLRLAVQHPDLRECEYYERFSLMAEIALAHGFNQLSPFAIEVANTICFLYGEMARKFEQEIKQEDRFANKTPPVPRFAPGYVYLIQSPTKAYKIGRTKDPTSRKRTFDVKLPFEVEFVCVIQTDDMISLEADLHRRFRKKQVNGEWFALTLDDVEYIKGLAK